MLKLTTAVLVPVALLYTRVSVFVVALVVGLVCDRSISVPLSAKNAMSVAVPEVVQWGVSPSTSVVVKCAVSVLVWVVLVGAAVRDKSISVPVLVSRFCSVPVLVILYTKVSVPAPVRNNVSIGSGADNRSGH